MNIFWRKFSKYLLLGLSIMVIVALAQQTIVGDFSKRGPDEVLALDEGGFEEPGFGGGTDPITEPAPAPEAPAPVSQPEVPVVSQPAPSCSEDVRYCDDRPGYGTWVHKHGGYWDGSTCVYAYDVQESCVSQPASAPTTSTCAPVDQLYTDRRCQPGTTQMCTYNRWKGTDCSEGWGGAYNCQNDVACGFSTPTPPPAPSCSNGQTGGVCGDSAHSCGAGGAGSCDACNGGWCNGGSCSSCSPQAPTPTPKQPTAPSCPIEGRTCPDGSVVSRNPGDGCNFYACPNTPTAPIVCTSNNSCSASAPTCGSVTSGVDNCLNRCTRTGGVCGTSVCRSNNSCSAPAPTCGSVTSGVDNCGNGCSRSGGACVITPPPAGAPAAPVDISISQPHTQTQTQTVTQTVTVPQNNTTTREVVREVHTFANVGVGTASAQPVYYANVKQLPKTGLPLLAWAAGAFIPAGFGLRRFKSIKKDLASHPSYLWEDRQYKSES